MIRAQLAERGVGASTKFRWRGQEVSRIEGLSDAVFAFSITLIVISLEVPKNFDELLTTMSGAAGFGLSFMLLMWLWYSHYLFFRRYGLQDIPTIILNTCLLFVVVLYVFPLKFLATLLVNQIIGASNAALIHSDQVATLMIVYSIGFTAIYAIFGLLYYNAYRQSEPLELTPLEKFDTFESLVTNGAFVLIGLVAIAIALSGGKENGGAAGIAYPVLIIPVRTILGFVMGRRRGQLERAANKAAS